MKKLIEEYETAKSAASVSQIVTGSGAAASGGSVAAGAGGTAFKVEGDVSGGIVIGNQNTVSDSKS